MNDFHCRFQIAGEFQSLWRPDVLCWERENSPKYLSLGSQRSAEQHCILHYCRSGRGRIRWKDRFFDIHSGECFLCIINDPEMDYFYPEDGTEEWSFLWFSYRNGASRTLTREMNERYSPVYELPEDSRILTRFRQLRKAGNDTAALSPFDGAELVAALFENLYLAQEERRLRRLPELVKSTMRIAKEREWTPDVQQLADTLNVSREHLSRLFHEGAGETLTRYLAEVRCKKACARLSAEDGSIAEIARDLGFADASSFTRAFRKYMSRTPGEFRESQRRRLLSVPVK